MQFGTTQGRRLPARYTSIHFIPVHMAMLAICVSSLAQEPEIDWIDNYPAAIAEAKATGKPLFVEFRCVP
jgi:hypothetical protein